MKVLAKCHNYSGCLKAYRAENIEIASDAALVCPECGKPLTRVASSGAKVVKMAGLVVLAAAAIGAGVYYGGPLLSSKSSPGTPANSADAGKQGTDAPAKTGGDTVPIAEPAPVPEVVTAPAKVELAVANAENKKTKAEVLTRIDVMPVSQASKDKLYASVQRARSMGKVLTIPFRPGKTTLTPDDIEALKTELTSPQLMKLRDDPTAVFVLLGYADPKGDKQKNITVSQVRADAVLAAMKDKCAVVNVMHSVAMGSSSILDSENLEKNRIVEIWAVLP